MTDLKNAKDLNPALDPELMDLCCDWDKLSPLEKSERPAPLR